jgi:hypothetical protein
VNLERELKEEQILLSLKRLDYLNRSQLQRLHNLGNVRKTNRFLKNMDDYVSHFRDGEKVYYLNNEGRVRVDCKKIRKKTPNVRHFLMRNDLYITLGRPTTWKNEMKISIPNTEISIICDALYMKEKKYHFIEIDNIQKMTNNKTKIEKYRKLADNDVFNLIWVTTTEYRKKRLETMSEGLNVECFLWDDIR